ncbi:hypothetical protein V6N11_071071 [Hibiscus sabdariffa]|uniref:Uncharacterized protein n=1 Tax=Hibiscus sabdariffa TaxID=183260 RepID=A0ABR2A798_9ROSI
MTQSKVIGVVNVKETDGQNLCLAIAKMIRLREIGVKSCNENEQVNMDVLESTPPGLEKLYLAGFQKLKVLSIGRCPRLIEIVINKGVMHGLQELNIFACEEFTTLPLGWESLPDINKFFWMTFRLGLFRQYADQKAWIDKQSRHRIKKTRRHRSHIQYNIMVQMISAKQDECFQYYVYIMQHNGSALVAAPRHVMAGEVGFHDVVPAVMDRMAEDIGLDLQARGHDGCDRIVAVRQQVDNGIAQALNCQDLR